MKRAAAAARAWEGAVADRKVQSLKATNARGASRARRDVAPAAAKAHLAPELAKAGEKVSTARAKGTGRSQTAIKQRGSAVGALKRAVSAPARGVGKETPAQKKKREEAEKVASAAASAEWKRARLAEQAAADDDLLARAAAIALSTQRKRVREVGEGG